MPSKKVTKYDLVEAVYRNVSCDKRIVQDVVENLIQEIKKVLVDGATIEHLPVIPKQVNIFPLHHIMLQRSVPDRN